MDLARWCDPRAADPALAAPMAWLALSPRAEGVEAVARDGRPLGVWAAGGADITAARGLGATIIATGSSALASRHRDLVLIPPAGRLDVAAIPWQPPFVRERRRRAARLPTLLVVDLRPGACALTAQAAVAAIAVASAVVVAEDRLPEALAWGAPCVTDAATVRRLGVRTRKHVMTAAPDEAVAVAQALARDMAAAARLSRAGRLWAERAYGRLRPVAAVAARLGLIEHDGWHTRIGRILDDLGTAAESPIRIRLEMLMGPLEAQP